MDRLENNINKKVYAYIITCINADRHLLVFNHVNSPEAGTQVLGGSVEPRENVVAAVVREAQEETGIENLHIIKKLGVVIRDLTEFGLPEVQERHYFLLRCGDPPDGTWISYEKTPSDGTPGPIAFRFYWARLDKVPELRAGLDEMLPKLMC